LQIILCFEVVRLSLLDLRMSRRELLFGSHDAGLGILDIGRAANLNRLDVLIEVMGTVMFDP
jgi:hypothetical protein